MAQITQRSDVQPSRRLQELAERYREAVLVIRNAEQRTGYTSEAARLNLLEGWSHVAAALTDSDDDRSVGVQLDQAEEHFRRAISEQTTAVASHRLADLASRWDEYARINPDDTETLRIRERVRALIDEARRLGIAASSWPEALHASQLALEAMSGIASLDHQLGERVAANTPRPRRRPRPQREPTAPDPDDLPQPAVDPQPQADGRAVRRLDFSGLDPEGFERLVFSLIASDPAYVNPQWLTHTNAPDRGRDLSVERIVADGLLGSRRERVFVQCRHTSASLTANDVEKAATPLRLWEPPVDLLVIATTARFTTDAVQWIEKFNQDGRTEIVPWANSHLELLLAGRPQIADEFGLTA